MIEGGQPEVDAEVQAIRVEGALRYTSEMKADPARRLVLEVVWLDGSEQRVVIYAPLHRGS